MKIKEITPVSVMPGLFYARSCCRQALQTGNRRKKYFLKIALSFPKKRPINRLDSRNANHFKEERRCRYAYRSL